MSTRSPTKRKQQALVSPRVQEIRDDEELHDGVPINRELAVASQLSSVEVSPGELEPARPPDTSILMGALIENWINTKYPGVSREHRRALFHEIAIEMTGSTGIDFEAAAHDSLATKRNEYISAVEDYAAARFDRLSLDVVAPTAQSAGLPPSCPNPGNGAVRGIIFPPRIVPKRSLSMPDERTMVASRALVKVMEASPFPTVHVQDSVIIGQQALAKTSRLHEEYLVHEMIGKGGFGEVFKVVHKLDHAVYALKQIRMRASDFVKEDLNVGVKRVLAELRTLAMMEHPNIVRYFYSWTESNHGLAVAPLEPPNHHADPLGKIVEEPSFSDGSKLTDASGPKIIFEKSESESADSESFDSVSEDSHSLNSRDINIVFEKSESESADSKTFDSVSEDSHSLNSRDISIVFDYSSSDETVSNKKAINDGVNVVFKDSTSGSVSENIASSNNDDMNIVFGVSSDEIATNEVDNSASSDSGTITEDASEVFADGSSAPGRALIRRRASINEPTVTVYITMSLHPVSLTNYITGRRSGRKIGHCFCPLASLYIFRDILNGVEYLHSKGIVHRDLKPGNVFLNVGEPMKCCDQPGSAVEPKIGDFGLVAVIDTEDSPLSESSRKEHHLGTTFYSAPEGGRSPAVDVWALGVILVELMCQFGTATERSIVLHKLTNGDSDVLDIDKRFTEIIKGCCCHDTRKRLHVPELKRVVANAIKELEELKVNPAV